MLHALYNANLGLLTDLYQLTMAYGYWKSGAYKTETTFQLFFRKAPFGEDYAISAGLDTALELIEKFKYSPEDLAYLEGLTGNDGHSLFSKDFLTYLENMKMSVQIDAIPEGTPVLAHTPLLRVTGPIIPCQLLESALLTTINFQTLIATKAHRVCVAAGLDSVLEFGLRRAQGFDGAISATRAAYIGGIDATSNVLAAKILDIPVKGTHAHAWVMMFDTEEEAFETYAQAMPNNCVFLVDTYDTLEGIQNAIKVGRRLRERGHEMLGIRLDSGDLTALSIAGRKALDDAGFPDAKIVASDSLNEHRIRELKEEGAKIDIWGVGTNLVTAQDQPALGGVYKLSAQRQSNEQAWIPKIKRPNSPIKVSNPGRLQVYRCYDSDEKWMVDILGSDELDLSTSIEVTELDGSQGRTLRPHRITPLLQPVFTDGLRLKASMPLSSLRVEKRSIERPSQAMPLLSADIWKIKDRLISQTQSISE